ncbi:two-component system phosphoglycerate transport system sensor histidine kinase PgtB [Mesocricetibacter intestinalis]|uniref:histidine kinase n=1 Tax=Mesocricetibacter intestinalis TaxID=1521930 RepID=A0A4R6VAV1_9PAST|nr:ATP-binding protein [Mesocricetibacter intestinalis]TDQ57404.1 two-component system phosphoglycerate transport system sensor histidine kinase PgtB [Mesocricetibacter intestinalis]
MNGKKRITHILRYAFAVGLFFTFLIGVVSLLSWYQQTKQVNYILQDYFPKTNLILKLEEDINGFISELDRFALIKNNSARQQAFKQLNLQLSDIENLIARLSDAEYARIFPENLNGLRELVDNINRNILHALQLEQERQALITKIQWQHDDFNNEFIALLQELNWQQVNFSEQSRYAGNRLWVTLQNELQTLYSLAKTEEQIKSELLQFLYQSDQSNKDKEYEKSKRLIRMLYPHNMPAARASIVPLQQMIESMVAMLDSDEGIDNLVANFRRYQASVLETKVNKDKRLESLKQVTDKLFAKYTTKFTRLNQQLEKQTRLSGLIIGGILILSLAFIWGFNRFYIKLNLTRRFEQLIDSVKRLNRGDEELALNFEGKDEISQLNKLLQSHSELIKERQRIEENLRNTQNELIQTAKFAVVGQTMTTLAHEINQPLNAISIYLFGLKKFIQGQDYSNALDYTDKITRLSNRIGNIIKGLRQFSKRHDQRELEQVDIAEAVNEAWALLEFRHRPLRAQLSLKGNGMVAANKGLLEQILVNLFTNSLEACRNTPKIHIEVIRDETSVSIRIKDNGEGWGTESVDKLLQPFYTNKNVGLGLGLTICQRIMQQFGGRLFLASDLTKSAVVILNFPYLNSQE